MSRGGRQEAIPERVTPDEAKLPDEELEDFNEELEEDLTEPVDEVPAFIQAKGMESEDDYVSIYDSLGEYTLETPEPVNNTLTVKGTPDHIKQSAIEMYRNGTKVTVIAEKLGKNKTTIYNWLKEYGLR